MKHQISKIKNEKSTAGFTLIEVMIATGLFVVIMVVGIGAVLSVNNAYKKTQKMRSIGDNLGFVMEDMTKTIRTGSTYDCPTVLSVVGILPAIQTAYPVSGCSPVKHFFISLQPTTSVDLSDPANQVVYAITPDGIFKSTDDGINFVRLTSAEVVIDTTKSGFTIIGAAPGDLHQPRVTINLEGSITYRGNETPFSLQTTVVSRMPDN